VGFKQNLPILAVLAAAGAVVLFLVVTAPSDDDLLRQAAAEHVKTLGQARDFQVSGDVVDVVLADGSFAHLAFVKRDDRWTFDRDLAADFARHMRDPAAGRELLERLGRRLVQRFNQDVKVGEGLQYAFRVGRDPQGVVGEVAVSFAYPGGETRPRGRYIETFRWRDRAWQSQGVGALLDSAAPR
jgi:hypothetical protein